MTRQADATPLAAFTEEFRQSLPAILVALDAADRDRSDRAAAHEAYRLIHALKGAASMVGLAALGHLLHVAEELIEGSIAGTAPLTEETLAILRTSIPQFGGYLDAALAGEPLEPVALGLARVLRQDDGPEAVAILRVLLEIEAREMAWLPAERVEPPADAAEALAVTPVLTETIEADDDRWTLVQTDTIEADDARWPPVQTDTIEAADARWPSPGPPPAQEPEVDLLPPEAIPAELAEVFGEEAREHLETIARFTASLSVEAQDRDALQELRRAVHTLKGAAGVVGFKGAAMLAHRMEDLLDRLYDGIATLTPPAVRTLAASSDALQDLIMGSPDPGALRVVVSRLFREFEALVAGTPAPLLEAAEVAEAVAAPPAPALPEHEEAVSVLAPDPGVVSERPRVDTPPASEREPVEGPPVAERRRRTDRRVSDRRGGSQVVRVPLPRLNELVRVVSELVINRSTFEQHHLTLVEEIEELKLATARLRKVTHRLESDFEVRALGNTPMSAGSKRAVTSAGGHGFDELEFDRYTEFHLLTRELTETTSDIATISTRVAGTIREFDGDLTRLGRLTREVQDKTMEFRMVPLGTLTTQLERTVRATADTCGKLVDFRIEGEHVALDKSLLEQMSDPLLHLLRNSVDHGIESPDRRQAADKPERGTITVRAFHEGTDVLIEVEDDGTGLDLDRIRRSAIAKGFMTEATVMSTDALFALIFEPGFSTASQVSEISGRGVGMDVVKSKVGRLGGRVYVTSRPGAGTTISVRVPMTLAMTRILLVRAGGQTFGLPLSAVVQIARPNPTAIGMIGAERVLTLDGRTYPLRNLADTLGLPRAADAPAVQPVLIANLSRRRIALAVDEIVNSRDAVVKTLGTHLRRVRGVWGATLLGDGTVVLILNPADLVGAADEQVIVAKPKARAVAAAHEPYTVLVVDDSLSMRHVLSLAVKKAGWIPVPARDGLEALEVIQRTPRAPDLVLLDIEMPRMDGFEFLSTIRAQKGRADLPIVMLTSRSGDKHRDKATALGATDYMVKPFHEDTLIRNIDRLVKASRETERRAAS